jgi:hypothetical protein
VIFRRLIAAFAAFHNRNTTHTTFSNETSPAARDTPPFADFDRIFFPVGIFRRLNADFTAFHTPNTTNGTFSNETSPAARITLPFVDFDPNFFPVLDISTFKRCFCCISHEEYNAHHF